VIPEPSTALLAWFVGLVCLLFFVLVAVVGMAAEGATDRARTRRIAAIALGLVLGVSGVAAASGWLSDFSPPPRPVLLFGTLGIATAALGASRPGLWLARGLPLWLLIGINAFRLPLELIMHRAADEGLMPVQMSYSGRNFDIATGVLAIVLGMVAYRGMLARWGAWLFNGVGFALLVNVVTIAVLSMPTPLRVFHNDPPNVWVATFPFVWLPAFFVQVALLSHVLILRRLRWEAHSGGSADER